MSPIVCRSRWPGSGLIRSSGPPRELSRWCHFIVNFRRNLNVATLLLADVSSVEMFPVSAVVYHVLVHRFAQRVMSHIRGQELLTAGDRVGIAVSGGVDSVALLRLLLALRNELALSFRWFTSITSCAGRNRTRIRHSWRSWLACIISNFIATGMMWRGMRRRNMSAWKRLRGNCGMGSLVI